MTKDKGKEINYGKFVDSDDEWGSFRPPTKKETTKSERNKEKRDSLNSRIDDLRDRLAQK